MTQTTQQGDFHGLPTQIFSNKHLRLEVLAEAGPRIVRLFLGNSEENLFAEVPDVKAETPYGDYYFRGGHRLWHAPEVSPRTTIPDNDGLTIKQTAKGILLTQPTEADTGIGKSIRIQMHDDRPALTLLHTLRNDGLWPIELAPWALTQLKLGGVIILPQVTAVPNSGLLPNRRMSLWPYTRWDEPRIQLHDDYFLLDARPDTPCKIGYFNTIGWAGYAYKDVLLCKCFAVNPEPTYPDFGCNVETYSGDLFVELETLGPLTRLEPGQSVSLEETWELYSGIGTVKTIDDVRTMVKKLKLG